MTSTRARSAITVTGLRKSFGDKVVPDGIDLEPVGVLRMTPHIPEPVISRSR
ncbi:hypothetical protein [Amycolatopsis sp. WAC 01375]|uniref:hypothetical protein n=1 Tax=Amycolatopsis sp. WAC 01375 TaxID=2203194 RepID=UPI0013156E2C|nr:hypothetical protein [Amycolatopsis sp. WAC 01375]